MLQRRIAWVILSFLPFLFAGMAWCAAGKEAAPKKEKAVEAAKGQESSKPAAAEADAGKNKVAVVNGTVISQAELDSAMARFEKQRNAAEKSNNPEELKELKKRVLQAMIDRELLLQEARKAGIKVEDAELDAQISNMKKRFGSEMKFGQMLEKWQFTEAQYRDNLKNEMITRKYLDQQLGAKTDVSQEEVKAFYDTNREAFKTPEEIRASHILVKVEPNSSAEDKNKAREKMVVIQERVKKGEDFAAVAKEVSDCPSKEQGGDLDFFSKGSMVGPFEDAAFALNVGAVSDIVQTEFGYHLIKVTDKRSESMREFDQVKGPIEQHLKQQRLGQQRNKYMEELRAKAKIEIFLN